MVFEKFRVKKNSWKIKFDSTEENIYRSFE